MELVVEFHNDYMMLPHLVIATVPEWEHLVSAIIKADALVYLYV